MPNYVKKIEVIGIHDHFDIIQEFSPKINIIHGINGSGKTTLIHIIANILNGQYSRFLYLDFFRIRVWFDDDNLITIYKNIDDQYSEKEAIRVCVNSDRRGIQIKSQINEFDNFDIKLTDYTQEKVILPAAYFPAFRTMVEAWKSLEKNTDTDETTSFFRRIFGDFLPKINYPSPQNVEQSLIYEVQEIANKLSLFDRQIMSQLSVDFVFNSLTNDFNDHLDKYDDLKKKIESLFKEIQNYPIPQDSYICSIEVYKKIFDLKINTNLKDFRYFLKIYYDSLQKIASKINVDYLKIYKYLSAVNSFLNDKEVGIFIANTGESNPLVKIKFSDGSLINGLDALSSGERQILTILYSTIYMSNEKIVLIDEPEISLHIDWQRELLKKISDQLDGRQIIACTHSPIIPADYDDYLKELESKKTDKNLWGSDEPTDEDKYKDELEDEDSFDKYDFIVDN
ncbi:MULTISPECIES: AAA family ATPase [unclassified Nodularia (in: cyanobacteria)]|uniref:AAA family ATPase n=1 Tax=unclassified Nodularia (in: cyanobacteria) TaxID=2656917 RepID=UPI0018816360|nr:MULTISPECIES: AAA family ATPase [unclassified Nodularia (in: cyanobacteria)]MBE9200800.1 AAA family ATPase [Nodularia sp. LEGE 06071]MCC2693818.1 AAA family ATPase [Nodularia sp. LEGE 04288]